MEKRYRVTEFATLIGCGAKTVYRLKDNGKIKSDKEIVNGREIDVIIADDEEIAKLQNIYMKKTDNVGKYYDNVTDNDINYQDNISQSQNNMGNGLTQSDIIDKIMSFSSGINEQVIEMNEAHNKELKQLHEELTQYKSRLPLLEDKANREGYYVKEISDLKTEIDKIKSDNEMTMSRKNRIFSVIVVILSVLFLTVSGILIYKLMNPTIIEKTNTIETIKEVKVEVPVPTPIKTNKKR